MEAFATSYRGRHRRMSNSTELSLNEFLFFCPVSHVQSKLLAPSIQFQSRTLQCVITALLLMLHPKPGGERTASLPAQCTTPQSLSCHGSWDGVSWPLARSSQMHPMSQVDHFGHSGTKLCFLASSIKFKAAIWIRESGVLPS